MSSDGISSVEAYTAALRKLLSRAKSVKASGGIEPALTASDFEGSIEELAKLLENGTTAYNQTHFAAIETACRNLFYDLLVSTSIDDPSFSEIWNILDIVLILSDTEQCEPGLVFWLVEELLDSQTLDGCRIVFDYLDSRRERLTAKHFQKKELIVLRSCNELLRRLSRAEDTVFCGRVFIFLFQSFPLGDKSSVNLRGEYHVENITTYEKIPTKQEQDRNERMGVDEEHGRNDSQPGQSSQTAGQAVGDNSVTKQSEIPARTVKFDPASAQEAEAVPDMDTLYPLFWSLQESFSTPTKLFDGSHFQSFKGGLEATIRKFRAVHQELQDRGSAKLLDESKRGLKRKRNPLEDEMSSSFNPKYLTSRDLFDLEMSDLAFRRHILVQALILIDFILSLTPKAKRKFANTTNKSVLYSYTVSDDDAKWATNMRTEIAAYLQQGPEGKFYYRMVDTVLSRDKNWVHWKAEGCPLIERTAISAEDFVQAQNGAQKACQTKKLRPTPMGSMDFKFLSDGEDGNNNGLEKLKTPERYTIPTVESFKGPIADDEFDIDMAKTDEEKVLATNARASKLWRTLRVASKSKLNLFDKIDDGNNLQALFQPEGEENRNKGDGSGMEQAEQDADLTEADHNVIPESGLEAHHVPESVVK